MVTLPTFRRLSLISALLQARCLAILSPSFLYDDYAQVLSAYYRQQRMTDGSEQVRSFFSFYKVLLRKLIPGEDNCQAFAKLRQDCSGTCAAHVQEGGW